MPSSKDKFVEQLKKLKPVSRSEVAAARSRLRHRHAGVHAFEADVLAPNRCVTTNHSPEQSGAPPENDETKTGSHALGAIIGGPTPILQPPKYDVTLRDELFAELSMLRKVDQLSQEQQARVADLEKRISAMLAA